MPGEWLGLSRSIAVLLQKQDDTACSRSKLRPYKSRPTQVLIRCDDRWARDCRQTPKARS
jgi:hypothetical protein